MNSAVSTAASLLPPSGRPGGVSSSVTAVSSAARRIRMSLSSDGPCPPSHAAEPHVEHSQLHFTHQPRSQQCSPSQKQNGTSPSPSVSSIAPTDPPPPASVAPNSSNPPPLLLRVLPMAPSTSTSTSSPSRPLPIRSPRSHPPLKTSISSSFRPHRRLR